MSRVRLAMKNAAACILLCISSGCTEDFAEPNAFERNAGDAGNSGSGGAPDNGTNPPKSSGGSSTSGGSSAAGSGSISPPTGDPPQDADCDLNGRWLVSQRILATAIGQEQASHNWFYLEIRHERDQLVVTKGLHCGYEVVKKTSLAASVDSTGAWAGFLKHNTSLGRKGSFVKEGTQCRLKLEREYVVRGATIAHYSNPSNKLPNKQQAATSTEPGWEDWDEDGNPGISLKVKSTLANGTLYTCQRDWTEYDGLIPTLSKKFKVAIKYGGEQTPLGRSEGSASAIESSSSPASDPSQHFAWFHELTEAQASGSDADICNSVRSLKDTLVPEANE